MICPRVEICGGIASGKTTLSRLIGTVEFTTTTYEEFSQNPFWAAFYAHPGAYVFETEVAFLLQHYHGVKRADAGRPLLVCDYSFALDEAYARMGLKNTQAKAFDAVLAAVHEELGDPGLLIHLQCDAEVELQRIRKRARKVEKSISIEFLSALNKAAEKVVRSHRQRTKVLVINSAELDFRPRGRHREQVLQLCVNAIKGSDT